jgi:ribonucleoside-triphosphate reductase
VHEQWEDFALAKRDHFIENPQRAQSNNSLIFHHKPSRDELRRVFTLMEAAGGSEPGIVNGQEALRRAPDFAVLNPCGESLLGDKSLCNLVEVNLAAFNGRFDDLCSAVYLLARANYRQTAVDLRDDILQQTWHELNQYLRLCGVGLTGYMQWEFRDQAEVLNDLYQVVRRGVDSMARELDLPYSKRVSLVKPSGTLSKVFDCTEGVHKPLGRYIFNNINFSKDDPLVRALRAAKYHTFVNPYDASGVVVRFPVCWDNVDFEEVDGKFVNLESAITQLERYKILMDFYVDHNVSVTISYSPDEVEAIVDWLMTNWDSYVSAAFMPRNDPTKTAADLGYPYLPQEVVTKDVYEDYVRGLGEVDLSASASLLEMESQECKNGFCPVR